MINIELKNKTALLDKLIFGCIIFFLISLNNSIFVNQLGYFGALILLLAKFFISKKNPFEKTGLEIPFLFLLAAEIISTVLSSNQSQSFHNLSKRFLLIPVLYTVISSTRNLEEAKLFFKVYLTAASLTILFYLGFSYKYYLGQNYQLEGKGPSPFQYVMTAGGLISFVVIYFFAFLVNEKFQLKNKLLILLGLLISSAALAASFTRAAWMGTAAGIFIVLLFSRKWILIGIVLLLFVGALFLNKNKSEIHILRYNNTSFEEVNSFATDGFAHGVFAENNSFHISDFQNGIVTYNDSAAKNKLQLPSPVHSFMKWKDNFYVAAMLESRLALVEKTDNNNFKIVDEFTSPGLLISLISVNNYLYAFDLDSGLTVFTNPENLSQQIRFSGITRNKFFNVDSFCLSTFSNENGLTIWQLKNFLPYKIIYTEKFETNVGVLYSTKNNLLFSTEKGTRVYKIDSDKVSMKEMFNEISNVYNFISVDSSLFLFDIKRNAYHLYFTDDEKIKVVNKAALNFRPSIVEIYKNHFLMSEVIKTRINSIVDLNHSSNIQRLSQWKVGWKVFRQNILFGIGDIDMQKVYSQFKAYYEKESFGHFHNNYVHLLACLGLFGFTAVSLLLIKIFFLLVKIYNSIKNISFASSVALGTIGCFTAFLISGLAEYNFGDHEIITMVWFSLGLNFAFYKFLSTSKNLSKQE